MNDVKVTNPSPRPVTAPVAVPTSSSGEATTAPAVVRRLPGETPASVQPEESRRSEAARQAPEEQQQALREAVTKLNEYVQSVQRDLQFDLDDTSGKTVIRVLERSTGDVVRQIPDDIALKLARNLQQDEPVSLFNAKA